MFKKNIPPAYGEFSGPIIVPYQWTESLSSIGPKDMPSIGSLENSMSSFISLFLPALPTVKTFELTTLLP